MDNLKEALSIASEAAADEGLDWPTRGLFESIAGWIKREQEQRDEGLPGDADLDDAPDWHLFKFTQENVRPLVELGWHPNVAERCAEEFGKHIGTDGHRVIYFRAQSIEHLRKFIKGWRYRYPHGHELSLIHEHTVGNVNHGDTDYYVEQVTEHHDPKELADYDLEREESRIQVCSHCHRDALLWDAAVDRNGELVSTYDNCDCTHCEGEARDTWVYPEEVQDDE